MLLVSTDLQTRLMRVRGASGRQFEGPALQGEGPLLAGQRPLHAASPHGAGAARVRAGRARVRVACPGRTGAAPGKRPLAAYVGLLIPVTPPHVPLLPLAGRGALARRPRGVSMRAGGAQPAGREQPRPPPGRRSAAAASAAIGLPVPFGTQQPEGRPLSLRRTGTQKWQCRSSREPPLA
jgi:hypothetical protein